MSKISMRGDAAKFGGHTRGENDPGNTQLHMETDKPLFVVLI